MAGPKPHLTPALDGLSPSTTVAINERIDALREAGKDVIKFGLGQSPFPVPDSVVAALRHHAPQKDYLPIKGLRTLRDVVATFHARRNGIEGRSGDDVVIGPGSKELLRGLETQPREPRRPLHSPRNKTTNPHPELPLQPHWAHPERRAPGQHRRGGTQA